MNNFDLRVITTDDQCISGDCLIFVCERCSFHALPFANDKADDHFSDIPVITTPSNMEYEGRSSDGIDHVSLDEFNYFLWKGLYFIHLSARCLLPKLDELFVLASKTNAAVISVSDTWL